MSANGNSLDDRCFRFCCEAIRFVRTIQPAPGIRTVIDQLIDAAGSVPANRQEASGASSRKEFIRYNEIALRSARESRMWLQVCHATDIGDQPRCRQLLDESDQLAKILASVVLSTKRGKPVT